MFEAALVPLEAPGVPDEPMLQLRVEAPPFAFRLSQSRLTLDPDGPTGLKQEFRGAGSPVEVGLAPKWAGMEIDSPWQGYGIQFSGGPKWRPNTEHLLGRRTRVRAAW